jgi:hypothetical protein
MLVAGLSFTVLLEECDNDAEDGTVKATGGALVTDAEADPLPGSFG